MFETTRDYVLITNSFTDRPIFIDGEPYQPTSSTNPPKRVDIIKGKPIKVRVDSGKYMYEYRFGTRLYEKVRHLEGETEYTYYYGDEFNFISRILLSILMWINGPNDNVSIGGDQ
jgi:hypothetical protein